MIFTDRTVIVQKGTSSINDTIVLYRGDKDIEIRFTLNEGSPFRFGSGASPNIIEKTEAAYGQLIIKTPNDLPSIFSEIAPTNNGKIVFTITAEMIDEITEVGNYTFQIRLLDESRNSRATLPEVVNGIEIREPIASEDTTNEVGVATVGYASTTAGTIEDTFDTQGNYNKTTWVAGDRITAAKLNKIEAGIDGVNKKVASGGSGGSNINDTTASATTTYSSNKIETIKEGLSSQIRDITNRVDEIVITGGGLTTAQITALDNMFKVCAYTSSDISSQYNAFKTAFDITTEPAEPTKILSSISATYSGGDVTVGTNLTDLTGIIVTATYSDNSTAAVTDYALSGTINEGTNTITVTYQGKTTTFIVNGVAGGSIDEGTNLLGELRSYRLNEATLGPMYAVTKSGNDYSISKNEAYTGVVTFQNGRLIGEANITTGKTYKLSVTEALSSRIYIYGYNIDKSKGDEQPDSGTLIGTFTDNTTEFTFTADNNYTSLRLALNSIPMELKGLKLEEV